MQHSFKILRILSVYFKVLAFGLLILMGIGLTGLLLAKEVPLEVRTNALVQNAVAILVVFPSFYALGEIIRLLLAVEAQARPQPQKTDAGLAG